MTLHTDSTGKLLVDLAATYGRRYRIGREDDGATWGQWPDADRAWLLEVRCQRGSVAPYGDELLQATTDRPLIGRRLRRLPGILTARGDLETAVTFHIDDAPAVFALLKPYRRRRLSEAQRLRLRAHGFQRKGPGAHTQSTNSGPESTNATQDAPMDVSTGGRAV